MSLLFDLLFPRTCAGCGRVGHYLCRDCQSKLVYQSVYQNNRLSLFRYHGAIKQLITDLKFSFVSDIVPEIGDILVYGLVNKYPHLLRYWQQNNYILVPIPLYESRHNWRGYNQSELLCQKLSAELNLSYEPNLLVRTRNTIPQTSIRDRRLRKTNINSSFSFRSDLLNSVKLLNFIIVDDVYTTGSTIHSAASAFPRGSNLWALTIAG
ncbi:MAG: double zinc ribbon domain-containing protein [Microgenomates group bacterium]